VAQLALRCTVRLEALMVVIGALAASRFGSAPWWRTRWWVNLEDVRIIPWIVGIVVAPLATLPVCHLTCEREICASVELLQKPGLSCCGYMEFRTRTTIRVKRTCSRLPERSSVVRRECVLLLSTCQDNPRVGRSRTALSKKHALRGLIQTPGCPRSHAFRDLVN